MNTPVNSDPPARNPGDNPPDQPAQKSKTSGISDFVKLISAVGVVIIPMVIAYIEYKQSIERDQDKIFREIVKELSSNEKENRVTGATNMGAYIRSDNKYHDVAVDILLNFVALESDLDVLNAISWSLKKIDKIHFNSVLDKLLDLNRNMLLNDQVTSYRVRLAKKNWDTGIQEVRELRDKATDEIMMAGLQKSGVKPADSRWEREIITANKKQMAEWENSILIEKKKQIYSLRKENLEMDDRRLLTANFIAAFLTIKPPQSKTIRFSQNTLNYIVLEDANLTHSYIVDSAFSLNLMRNTNFSRSTIENTLFTNSSLEQTDFSNTTLTQALFDITSLKGAKFNDSTFSEVFFLDADITNADFRGAKGLKPVYFYRALNKEKAIFDEQFKAELEGTQITHDYYEQFIRESKLTNQRYDSLLKSLDYTNQFYEKDEIPKNQTSMLKSLIQNVPASSYSDDKQMLKDNSLEYIEKLLQKSTEDNTTNSGSVVSSSK